jgi:4-amino-4-deoxy-L-arabinose transferase-like glycosyltransferase
MKKISWLIVLILILAVFLRIFRLESVPPALFGDEIDVGYQAYSLLHTGKDLTGRVLPFYLKSLTEYRTPLFIYSAVPFVGIFGLNEYGVRIPAVFWGIVSIVGIYLLVLRLFNKNTALIAAGLTAISPWHLQYSRASFEVTMLISFIIFGVYFFLLGLSKNRYFFVSVILFLSSVYIYSTAVVFVPLLILLLLTLYWKDVSKVKLTNLFLLILTGAVILIPMLVSMVTGEAKERFSAISIFQDTVLIDKINLARKGQEFYNPDGDSVKISPSIEMFFYNKPMIFAQVFITNYFRSLSPTFLFSEGDINFRQGIHEMGAIYYFECILIILGMFALVKFPWRVASLVFGWLLLAPVPSSLTFQGGFHATRLFIMLPPLIILGAVGANWILENKKKRSIKVVGGIVALLMVFNIVFYLYRYHVHYGPESWRWWHVGFKEAMQFMKEKEGDYKFVGFNNTYEPSLIRFLFWNGVDPSQFQAEYAKGWQTKEVFPGYDGFMFKDKYFFGFTSKPIQDVLVPGTIYMVSARDEVPGDWDWAKNPPAGLKTLKTIRNPLNEPIFYVVAKD